jgi:hypothetical protein
MSSNQVIKQQPVCTDRLLFLLGAWGAVEREVEVITLQVNSNNLQ